MDRGCIFHPSGWCTGVSGCRTHQQADQGRYGGLAGPRADTRNEKPGRRVELGSGHSAHHPAFRQHDLGSPHRNEHPEPEAHGKGQRQRPEGSVLAPMVHLPLTGFLKFLKGENGGLKRLRLTRDRASRPSWIIRTDASTTGAGGILLTASGKPVRWWAHPLEANLLDPLGVKAGEPGKMTTYEILALLISLRTWSTHIRNHRIGVLVQLDSESALRVATKLASPHPVVNRLAAEVALCLENLRLETITGQHWRNVINIEADALSRLQEGYSVPSRLQKLPRDNIVPTSELFFLHSSSVASRSFVSSRRRGGVVCCPPFRFSRVPVLVVSVVKYLPQLGSSSMFCLLILATWGIVPWDLTTFLVCDLQRGPPDI